MKREIKFRGQREDNGNIVWGNLFYWNKYGKNIPIIGEGVKNGSVNGYEVNPNTIGQFTGLTDKNGKEIYEGDILAFENILNFEKVLQNHFEVKWQDYGNGMVGFTQFHPRDKFVVAGNIHENPELLKP